MSPTAGDGDLTGASRAPRWAVVGGGMLGLTLARRLAAAGASVTLYEAADRLGGLASAWSLGDVVWDRHYHVTLASDAATRGILSELGLDAEMRWVRTRTGYYAAGRLSSVSSSLEFLRLPGLSPLDKARLGTTIVYASRVRDWERLERITVEEWLTRLSGRSTFERFWLPLLRAKLGESYREASAAFIWATIRRLYAARRSGMKRELFGYVPGGYARVLEAFGRAIREQGVSVRLSSPVDRVRAVHGGELEVAPRSGGPERFDGVVVTATGRVAASICAGLSEEEQRRLRDVRMQGIVCASLLVRQPLSPYYLTYITDPVPFTAVVEMTAFVDRAELGGHALVYLPKYVPADDSAFDQSDEELRLDLLPALVTMHPSLRAEDVLAFRVSRVREVFPVPTLGYSRRVPAMHTSVAGLHVVNSSQIVNGTLNVDETVQLAERAAVELTASPAFDGVRPRRVRAPRLGAPEPMAPPLYPGPPRSAR